MFTRRLGESRTEPGRADVNTLESNGVHLGGPKVGDYVFHPSDGTIGVIVRASAFDPSVGVRVLKGPQTGRTINVSPMSNFYNDHGWLTADAPEVPYSLHTPASGPGTKKAQVNEDVNLPGIGDVRQPGRAVNASTAEPYGSVSAARPDLPPGPMSKALAAFQQERGVNPEYEALMQRGLPVVDAESLAAANWGVNELDKVSTELRKGTRESLAEVEKMVMGAITDFVRLWNPEFVLAPRYFTPEAYKAQGAMRGYQMEAARLNATLLDKLDLLGQQDPATVEKFIWTFHRLQNEPLTPELMESYLSIASELQQRGKTNLHYLQKWATPDKKTGLAHLPATRKDGVLTQTAHEWYQQALAENDAYYMERIYNMQQGALIEAARSPLRNILPQGLNLRSFKGRLPPIAWLEMVLGKEKAAEIEKTLLNGLPEGDQGRITMDVLREAGYGPVIMAAMKERGLDTSMYSIEMTNRHQAENTAKMAYMDYILNSDDLFKRIGIDDVETQQALLDKGWLPISSVLNKGEEFSAKLGPLNNISGESSAFINPALKDSLSMLNTAGPEYWQGLYMDGLRWWKILHTAWAPGVAGNNYMSAMLAHPVLAGYPIWRHGTDAYETQFGASGFWKQGDRYKFWRNQGLFKANTHYRMEMDSTTTGNSPFAVSPDTWFGKIGEGIAQWKRDLSKEHPVLAENLNPLELYGNFDDAGRMYLAEVRYKDLLSKGVPDSDAALQSIAFAHKYQVDYANMPSIIRAAQRGTLGFLSPFISYPYGIAKLTGEALATRPWALAEIPLFLTALGFAGRSILGMTPEEEEASKPHYMRGTTTLLPFRSANNQPQYFDAARMYAPAQFASIVQGDPYYLWNMLLPGGPIWPIVEAIRGYSLFFREDLYNHVTDTPGEKFKKGMQYITEQQVPALKWAASFPQSVSGKPYGVPERQRDIFGALVRPFGFTVREGGVGAILGKMRQVKQGEIELNRAKRKKQRELGEGFITPEVYQSSLADIMAKRRALMERSQRTWPYYSQAYSELERSRNEPVGVEE